MKISLATTLGLLLLILLFALTRCATTKSQEPQPSSAMQLLTQLPGLIEQSADLVVLTVSVDARAEARQEGFLGACRVAGRIRGVLRIGGDLGALQARITNAEQHLLEMVLPEPMILHVSIDHQACKVTSQREGLWQLALGSAYESELTEKLYADTLETLKQYPLDPGVIHRAKLHTEAVLRQLIEQHGWTVTVRWRPS